MKRFVLATLFVVSAVALIGRTATAQSAPPVNVPVALNAINSSLNTVSSTLSALVATVNSLGTKITELTNTIGTPPPAATTVAAGPLSIAAGEGLQCSVVNLGTTRATGTVSLSGFGQLGSFNLGPGETTAFARTDAIGALQYCRFDSAQVSQLSANLEIYTILTGVPVLSVQAK